MSQESLKTVLDHIYAMRCQDLENVASRLHPDVVHQGVLDHLVCNGRDEVLQNMRGALQNKDLGVDRIDFVDAGDRVIVGLAGPRFQDLPWAPLLGQLFIVYTVRDGKIVRMDDYRTRAEAFTAAGLTLSDWK